ncbi:MAG: conserved rane protein of unknown function [Pseudonocardiales bacterium]|nr:conserved rane protein of unknown function [Pseudonocardiales bacterium]
MTTPPSDPTSSPSYGDPAPNPNGGAYGPGSGYEGATNGFGQPFVPLSKEPDDVQRAAAARAAQGQWQQTQPPQGQPDPYGQNPNPYGQNPNPYGQNPYAQPQPPNPYGAPGYPQQYAPPYFPPTPARNGLATAAMVLGIISIPGALFSFFDLPIAIVGLILGIVALKKSKALHGIGHGAALAGVITSIIGLVLATIVSVYLVNRMQDCSTYEFGSTDWSTCVTAE